ncbi:MAG: glycosyltransferase [Planctomycetota bacterium]|nr:glycosyltransferase [Planctomycetota bacterium]
MPLVSIVVAAYNCADWINATLGDVFAQSYTHFELIFVDDGSSDKTYEVVSAISDPRLRVVRQPNSGSPAKPRNTGLALAKGSLVTFLDHDDRWHPRRLETVVARFVDPDCDLICHSMELVIGDKVSRVLKLRAYAKPLYLDMMLKGNYLLTSATTIRTDLVRRAGGFDERKEYFSVEDYDLWLRLAKAGARFVFLNDVLGQYVKQPSGMSANVDTHVARIFSVTKAHMRDNWEILEPYENRILGRTYYDYGRELHRGGFFRAGLEKYREAVKLRFFSPKLAIGMALCVAHIKPLAI